MKTPRKIEKIVIVGGGSAGWTAAACLSRLLLKPHLKRHSVTLVESADIGIIGVGEATVPSVNDLIRFLNIDEADFIKETDATYKLAIRFQDWHSIGNDYWHPFGDFGPMVEAVPAFQHWLRLKTMGQAMGTLDGFSISAQMAKLNRFAKPVADKNTPLGHLSFAYHFDAVKVADYLKGFAVAKGAVAIDGLVVDHSQDEDGMLRAIKLKDGRTIEGDFFIDCSGFAGVLIDKVFHNEYENWSHWLPVDQAVAAPCAHSDGGPIAPYTVSQARDAGWTWKIPLKSRIGNGYVYASQFCDRDTASQTLLNAIGSAPLAEPRHIGFKPGRRKETWVKNCLSLGLASGFLEPLESTAIHLVISSLFRFFDHLPRDLDLENLRLAYNRRNIREIEEIRDFIILHYFLSQRRDTPFWQYVTQTEIPDSLKAKIDIFKREGKILGDFYDLFRPTSWISIFDGNAFIPNHCDLLAELIPLDISQRLVTQVTEAIAKAAQAAPPHMASRGYAPMRFKDMPSWPKT